LLFTEKDSSCPGAADSVRGWSFFKLPGLSGLSHVEVLLLGDTVDVEDDFA
jgi:hypothetical protein